MRHLEHKKLWIVAAAALALLAAVPAPAKKTREAAARKGCQVAVVLDFSLAPRVTELRDPQTRELKYSTKPVESEKDIKGWWFGSLDVFYNDVMGNAAADVISDALRANGPFKIYSREDLRYYYADKRELIEKKFDSMDRKTVDQALLALNPVSIGREIGAGKVIVGRVCDTETRVSRAFGFYTSASSFWVAVYDTASGKIEFQKQYGGIRAFRTQYSNFEKDAQQIAADISAYYAGR